MAKIQSKRNSTKKEVIIEKASKLFREKGFGAASMRDLAEHVGLFIAICLLGVIASYPAAAASVGYVDPSLVVDCSKAYVDFPTLTTPSGTSW